MKAERVLVTGASGFLGHEIVRQNSGNYSLIATGRRPIKNLDVDFFAADLLGDDLGKRLPDNIDTIIHTAGLTSGSEQEMALNVQMVRRIIEWAVKIGARNLLLISSAAVYSRTTGTRQESSACEPITAYGRSKLESENYAIAACSQADIRLVILRKPALIGPTRGGSIVRLIHALRRNRFVLLGDGCNQKSLISVSDAAQACLATLRIFDAEQSEAAHRIFNVSAGTMKITDIVDVICQELGRSHPPNLPAVMATLPLKALSSITFGARPFGELLAAVEQFLSNDVLDSSLFREHVDFQPSTEIGQALREMVRYQD